MSFSDEELSKRQAIIDHCLKMNSTGLNQGTSGNISIRHKGGLLISPSSRPYASLKPVDIMFLEMDGTAHGPWAPSSEWRFHRDIMASRPDTNAIVHAHPNYCTTLAIMGKAIPAIHYMIAIFGGPTIRCAPYAIYGSEELSNHALEAMEDRNACLLGHHGMIAAGANIEQTFWLAEELETLARQYHGCLQLGDPPLLSDEQIADVIEKFQGYGMTESDQG
ncbi:MAG: class II aldolase/adducin family protein [Pseudomonadota bacterium]